MSPIYEILKMSRWLLLLLILGGCASTFLDKKVNTDNNFDQVYEQCRYQAYASVQPAGRSRSGSEYRQVNELIEMCLKANGYYVK